MPWTSASSSSWVVAFGEAIRPPRVACSAAMSWGGTRSYIVWCLHHLGGRDAAAKQGVPPFLCLGSVRGSHAGEVVQATGDVGPTDGSVFFEQPAKDWFGRCVAHDAGQLFSVLLAGGVGLGRGRLVGLCTALRCTLSAHRLEVAPQVPVCESRDVAAKRAHVDVAVFGVVLDRVQDRFGFFGGGVGAGHHVHSSSRRGFGCRRRLVFLFSWATRSR